MCLETFYVNEQDLKAEGWVVVEDMQVVPWNGFRIQGQTGKRTQSFQGNGWRVSSPVYRILRFCTLEDHRAFRQGGWYRRPETREGLLDIGGGRPYGMAASEVTGTKLAQEPLRKQV